MGGQLPFGTGLHDWISNSPFFSLQNVIAPVRIEVHNNGSILNYWSEYAGLRQLHKRVDLIQLPNATHEIVQPREELYSVEGNIDWFDFWLNGHEDPDPLKAQQYQRWKAL